MKKKSLKKRIIALTLTAVLSLGLIGCSSANDEARDHHRDYTSPVSTDAPAAVDGGGNYNYKMTMGNYSMAATEGMAYDQQQEQIQWNTEEYKYIDENGWKVVSVSPFSTFAADVDTASYANLRRMITQNRSIPADAVRIEELINYFKYDYKAPKEAIPSRSLPSWHPAPGTTRHSCSLWASGPRIST